ncbi:MAG: hypothetical protein DRO73_01255 [Candidatus Thorarchaeota archaeon]|nr:MAG: hypothetical protein DRO73_01255 [Candidatus Thorarchaeota archaeon]
MVRLYSPGMMPSVDQFVAAIPSSFESVVFLNRTSDEFLTDNTTGSFIITTSLECTLTTRSRILRTDSVSTVRSLRGSIVSAPRVMLTTMLWAPAWENRSS